MSIIRRFAWPTLSAALMLAAPAQAHVTKIVITGRQSPAFGGYAWPGVGQYERISGKAYGELDPNDPKNALIADIALAPRNARGMVEYAFDFYILKPIDLAKGNHKMVYEPPNRGGKTIGTLNRGVGGNDPGAITDAALLKDAFLMPQGYSVSFSGWDAAAGHDTANFNTTITLPVAKNPDGSAITGPSYEYIVTSTASYTLTYPAASPDQATAVLTHRVHLNDPPQVVPATGWAYDATGKTIHLLPEGTPFVANDIYELRYVAKDPSVNGIGLAAVRDWNAFLRNAKTDDFGTPNPMAGDITRIYTETLSQPGRFLNDFRYYGFNQDERGRKVFDGMMQWIAAGDGISLNARWSQPGRTERNRQDHLYDEGRFPFADVTTTDPFTGRADSRLARCEASHTCPVAMEIYSSNEYWVKAASLMSTDPSGKSDLPDSPYARLYLISSGQHGTGNATKSGVCQQLQNPLDSAPVQRALFVAMDQWVTKGTRPPPSQVPKLSDGTLVAPLPQAAVGFPNIPGVTYTGLKTTRYLLTPGAGLVAPYQDNPANGPIYPSFIPRTDADGNDVAGIRLPRVSVPLATYTGWALRSGAWADDGCEGSGQFIPFARTQAERKAKGDPRRSAAERYDNFDAYARKVDQAVKAMIAERTLLPEDAPGVTRDALDLGRSMLP